MDVNLNVSIDIDQEFKRLDLNQKEHPNIINSLHSLHQEPDNAKQWYNLGVYLTKDGRVKAGCQCYLNSIKCEPLFKSAHNNLGAIYKSMADYDRSIYHYKKALESDPNFSKALNNIGITYQCQGKLGKAIECGKKAIKLIPNNAVAFNHMGAFILNSGCSAEDALPYFVKCCDLDPIQSAGRFYAYSNRLLCANSTPAFCEDDLTGNEKDTYNAKIFQWHKEWAVPYERRYDDVRFRRWYNNRDPNCPIRVGYLSSDLREHPLSYFAEAALKHMDEKKVEIYVYFNGPPGDDRTEMIRTKIPDHHWRILRGRKVQQCAKMIYKDKIDILVELGGHTACHRLDIMVLKPAPIQVTWIGYANTTGLSVIDYRITDAIADPVTTQQRYSEELVRMPEPFAFLCYTGTEENDECTGAPALKNGYVTFGSFNALHKLTDQCIDLWCRILNTVFNSHLILKDKAFGSEMIRNQYIKRFKNYGISESRIKLRPHVPKRKGHLDLYKTVDISLDPFPYAGTTTSAESLWMGCPFITLNRVKFPIHAQNVGTSLLNRIPGLDKFIAKNKQQYIDIAVYFSKQLEELNEIKVNLRNRMIKSPLCDGPGFCDKLTDIYRKMWQRYTSSS